MTLHELLGDSPESMIDAYSYEVPPVLTVDPGDTVIVHTLNASGHLERQRTPGEDRPVMFPDRRGHCLVGPIAVRGAVPGQVLAVRFVYFRPDDWGFTATGGRDNVLNRMVGTADGPTAWLLWDLDPDGGTGTNQYGFTVPLAPFLGVTGLAPDEPGDHSTIPPRTLGGGNIDCRELTAGSTLYLPVTVPEAYLFLGDGHAAQGDGEVGGTAIECGMTSRVKLSLLEPGPVDAVHAITPTARITFGFDPDLNRATGDALSAMVTWLQMLLGLERSAALATASVAVDLHVTQVANETWGAHAVLPHSLVPATSTSHQEGKPS
jgi:acetamidase/formamidase